MAGCRPLTPVEAAQVAQAFGEGFYGVRSQTLFIVNLKTGFRISALLSLTVGDICHQGEVVDYVTVHRRHQKQHTASHTVPLHHQAQQALGHKWITSTQAYLPVDDERIRGAILAS